MGVLLGAQNTVMLRFYLYYVYLLFVLELSFGERIARVDPTFHILDELNIETITGY